MAELNAYHRYIGGERTYTLELKIAAEAEAEGDLHGAEAWRHQRRRKYVMNYATNQQDHAACTHCSKPWPCPELTDAEKAIHPDC